MTGEFAVESGEAGRNEFGDKGYGEVIMESGVCDIKGSIDYGS